MDVYDAIRQRRSIRKFQQDKKISREVLERLVEAARLAPSGANLQPVKYLIADDDRVVAGIFDNVKWAGYLAPYGDPKEGEKPVAYIALLQDKSIRESGSELDVGAAAQNIFLAAVNEGIGTCWIGSINRKAVRELLKLPENLILNTVIAAGYPGESPIYEDESGSIKYYRDGSGVLHVPKRKMQDIVFWNSAE